VSRTRTFLTIGSMVLFAVTSSPVIAGAQDLAAKGQAVYVAQKCSTCHMIAGKGNKASPLDGVGTKLSAADIREWITNPTEMTKKAGSTKKPPMPNRYSKLPAADIDALVAYIQSLK
jgi:mono/diheme cytochrome c family protein